MPLNEQQARLSRVIAGHCAYYGVTGNSYRLSQFRFQVTRSWRKWLSRRSRVSKLNWERMNEFLLRFPLPPARVVRSVYAN